MRKERCRAKVQVEGWRTTGVKVEGWRTGVKVEGWRLQKLRWKDEGLD